MVNREDMNLKMKSMKIVRIIATACSCVAVILAFIFVFVITPGMDPEMQYKILGNFAMQATIVLWIINTATGLFGRKYTSFRNKVGLVENNENEKDAGTALALLANYSAVYYVDFEADEVRFIQMGQRIQNYMGKEYAERHPFEYYVNAYSKKLVLPECQEEFCYEVSRDNLTAKLADHKYYTYIYLGDKNGTPTYFQMRAARIENNPNTLVVGFADVDDEVRGREKEREVLIDSLNQTKKANKAKDEFISNMSHEMRTPLNGIMGLALLIESGISDAAEIKEYSSQIMESSKDLLRMVENVLDMSKIKDSVMMLDEKPSSIKYCFYEIKGVLEKECEEKGLKLTASETVSEKEVYCDIRYLKTAFSHITSNAVKYTPEGGKVEVSLTETGSGKNYITYEFKVTDTGIGMDEEFIKHMFEPFRRAASTTESGIFGTGVGLTITKYIIELMDGSLDIQSKKGEGTTVTAKIKLRIE